MKLLTNLFLCLTLVLFFTNCDQKTKTEPVLIEDFGGFESQVAWGEHLVTICDCNICHTPKIMTDRGPILDPSLILAGHPEDMPRIEIDRENIEKKGLTVAGDFTEWVGPWGVSFAANITPDETGIGNWTEEQFFLALREGKYKGLPGGRTLLPPMPWESFAHMTDGEVKAIFAYLKTVKPVRNLVPSPIPPTSAGN